MNKWKDSINIVNSAMEKYKNINFFRNWCSKYAYMVVSLEQHKEIDEDIFLYEYYMLKARYGNTPDEDMDSIANFIEQMYNHIRAIER